MDPLPPVTPLWVLGAWAPRWLLWFLAVAGAVLVGLAISDAVISSDGLQLFRVILPLLVVGVAAATLRHRAREAGRPEQQAPEQQAPEQQAPGQQAPKR